MEGYVGDEQEVVDRQSKCPLCGKDQPCLHPVANITFKAIVPPNLRMRIASTEEEI